MSAFQQSFRSALLNPDTPAPVRVQGPGGAAAGKRFDVYRNNVTVSLVDALVLAFPLVHKLLGGPRFRSVATEYVRKRPPSSPLMMHYGEHFSECLANFEALKHIGYLPDAARLDMALRRSYHAADATEFDPSILQSDPDHAVLHLAPATAILRSDWPLFDIWRFNFVDGAPKPRPVPQDILITRPEFDPSPHLLQPGAAIWFEKLQSGHSLAEALEATITQNPDFDLTEALTLALTAQAFTSSPHKDHP